MPAAGAPGPLASAEPNLTPPKQTQSRIKARVGEAAAVDLAMKQCAKDAVMNQMQGLKMSLAGKGERRPVAVGVTWVVKQVLQKHKLKIMLC